MSRGNFAHVNAAHLHGLGAGAVGSRAAWNHGAWNHGNWNHGWNHWGNNWRGGWNGGCCGGWWFGGPVFWPFFAGDLLAFTFWPWGFYDPFWATETCSCGMRCSGPVPSIPTARMVMFMAGMPRRPDTNARRRPPRHS